MTTSHQTVRETALPAVDGRRPKVVVLSTFPVFPRAFGGQLRSFHVYGALTGSCDVEIISLTEHGQKAQRLELAPGFTETLVPRTAKQARLEAEGTTHAGGFVGDALTATLTPLYTPAYIDALRHAATGAAVAILAQPYMHPSLHLAAPALPFAYDAYNVEVRLKAALLPESADTMLALVRETEGDAVRGARIVFACSAEDRDALVAEFGVSPPRVAVVPNGVDVDAIAYVDGATRRDNERTWLDAFRRAGGWEGAGRMALFLGSNHLPNQEAVSHMLGVVDRFDDVLLAVAGWVGLPFLESGPSTERATFLGPFTPETKRVLLRSAGVGLNPVTRGSGTNLKVLEYFAAGIPVVCTPHGARGLDVHDGVELRIADVDAFADTLLSVLGDPASADEMTRLARRLAERRYAWNVVAEPMLEWLRAEISA